MAKQYAKGVSPGIVLDRGQCGPLYLQIVAGLRRAIEQGQLNQGARLAATRVLADDWGVSRNTVVQAFDQLIAEGYVIAKIGDGSYVADALPEAPALVPGAAGSVRFSYPLGNLSRRGRSLVTRHECLDGEDPMPFRPDLPDLREFPLRSWLRLMNEVSGGLKGNVLAGVSSIGHPPLRKAIAHHVAATRGLSCKPEQVIITTGSQQSLDLITRLLLDRGDPVWMEEPGYVGTRAVLQANGCNVQFVPVDGEGLDVEAGIRHRVVPRLICISPARQYPTGAIMTARRAAALLDVAVRTGAWILEDDYDSSMFFSGPPPLALFSSHPAARVIFSGTFSKTLVPSLRLGYLILPEDLVASFQAARGVSQGHSSLLEQMVLAEMIGRGLYAAHVRRMRVLYRSRQLALAAGLLRHLDYCVPLEELRSGMHVVLHLRDGVNDHDAADLMRQSRIVVRPLSPYFGAQPARQGLLLGFAAFPVEVIERATANLGPLRPLLARAGQST